MWLPTEAEIWANGARQHVDLLRDYTRPLGVDPYGVHDPEGAVPFPLLHKGKYGEDAVSTKIAARR
jgi:hypothetical protein